MAIAAVDLDRLFHVPHEPPIAHDVVLRVAVDAVHAALMMGVRRQRRRIMQEVLAMR